MSLRSPSFMKRSFHLNSFSNRILSHERKFSTLSHPFFYSEMKSNFHSFDNLNNLLQIKKLSFRNFSTCLSLKKTHETANNENLKWTITETDYGALEVTMNSNPVNCLNEEFFEDLLQLCIRLESYPPHLPVVLKSASNKIFSAGLDLPHVASLDKQDDVLNFVDELNRCFTRLYLLNRPTIAVVSDKHAIAGGLILAMCCDFQVIVTNNNKAKYFLKEVALGIPFPGQTFYIVEKSISDHGLLKEMTLTAKEVTAEEGVRRGLFSHGVESVDQVEDKIKEIVGRLDHEKSHDAYQQVKRLLKANPFREWMERTDTESLNTIFAQCLLKDTSKELLLAAVGKKK